jgi:hypothetical protein
MPGSHQAIAASAVSRPKATGAKTQNAGPCVRRASTQVIGRSMVRSIACRNDSGTRYTA